MISPKDELTALLTLSGIDGIGPTKAKTLYDHVGSALDIFRNHKDLPTTLPGVTQSLIEALDDSGSLLRAEKEISYAKEHGIRCLTFEDEDYPARMRDCNDAPLVLFTLGNADFNAEHTLCIVGTRDATAYGKELTAKFVRDIKEALPDTLIISGLAYGIDVAAHKACLENGIPTVGVLAHGLDRIYPESHRSVASSMLEKGGLVTEYMSGVFPLRENFVRRNRIIAAMSDACVVVESASKGGSLVTAEMAEGYYRPCFAFPGCVGDRTSAGCNELIRDNKAGLITSADDFLSFMGWCAKRKKPVQKVIFDTMTPVEARIMKRLQESVKGVQFNVLASDCDIPAGELTAVLLEMEMKDMVTPVPGSVWKRK